MYVCGFFGLEYRTPYIEGRKYAKDSKNTNTAAKVVFLHVQFKKVHAKLQRLIKCMRLYLKNVGVSERLSRFNDFNVRVGRYGRPKTRPQSMNNGRRKGGVST